MLDHEFQTIVEDNLTQRTRTHISSPRLMASLAPIEVKRIKQEILRNVFGKLILVSTFQPFIVVKEIKFSVAGKISPVVVSQYSQMVLIVCGSVADLSEARKCLSMVDTVSSVPDPDPQPLLELDPSPNLCINA